MLIKGSHKGPGLSVRELPAVAPKPEPESARAESQARPARPAAPSQPDISPEIRVLEDELAHVRSEMKTLTEAARSARRDAFDEGRKAALDEFQSREEERLAVLERSAATALDGLDDALKATENFALALSAAAVKSVLGDAGDHQTQIAEAIGVQLSGVRAESVLRLRVSRQDFDDLSGLKSRFDTASGLDWVHDDTLNSGEMKLDLRLGQFNLDLAAHWDQVIERLQSLASQAGRAA